MPRSHFHEVSSCHQLDFRASRYWAIPLWPAADRVRRAVLRLGNRFRRAPAGQQRPLEASYVPLFAHLALVLVAGIYLRADGRLFQHVAGLLG